MRNDSTDYSAWIKRARTDLRFAQKAYCDLEPAYDLACYLGQQCAEKSIKALLIYNDIEYSRQHMISELIKKLPPKEEAQIQNSITLEEFAFVDEWATAGRYPGDAPEASSADADSVIKTAEKIYTFVLKEMK